MDVLLFEASRFCHKARQYRRAQEDVLLSHRVAERVRDAVKHQPID